MNKIIIRVGFGFLVLMTLSSFAIPETQQQRDLAVQFLKEQLEKGTLTDIIKMVALAEMVQKGNVEAVKLLLNSGIRVNTEMARKLKESVKMKFLPEGSRDVIFTMLDNAVSQQK